MGFVHGRISCWFMGSCLVLCKYVLRDGLWDLLACIPLSCSLQVPLQKFLNLKPSVNLPPPSRGHTLVTPILWFLG